MTWTLSADYSHVEDENSSFNIEGSVSDRVRLVEKLNELEAEADELNQLFYMEHQRDLEACMRWRSEDPTGRALLLPDRGNLLDYLWQELMRQGHEAKLEPQGVIYGDTDPTTVG